MTPFSNVSLGDILFDSDVRKGESHLYQARTATVYLLPPATAVIDGVSPGLGACTFADTVDIAELLFVMLMVKSFVVLPTAFSSLTVNV